MTVSSTSVAPREGGDESVGRNIPDEDLAIACVEDMMLRIRNHPSLVHLPGTRKTVTVRAYTRDLAGAEPAVRVGGWNAKGPE